MESRAHALIGEPPSFALRAWLGAILFSVTAVTLARCSDEKAKAAPAEQQQADSHARDKTELIVTSTNGNWTDWQWDFQRLTKVQNLEPHVAVLKLRNCLKEAATYTAHFSLRDPDNKDVALENRDRTFTAAGPQQNVWCVYQPPYEAQKPGKWKWTATVEKIGSFSQEIAVEPLTPQDERGLRNYQQAREAALLALGNYWVGVITEAPHTNHDAPEKALEPLKVRNADFFTAIVTEDYLAKQQAEETEKELGALKEKEKKLKSEKEAAEVYAKSLHANNIEFLWNYQAKHPEWNVTWKFKGAELATGEIPRNLQVINADIQNLPTEEENLRQKIRPITNICYLQIRGLTPITVISDPFLSEADGLNGITFRGHAMFGFRVYRYYYPESGWTDWYDAAFVPQQLSGIFARTFGSVIDSLGFPNLSFSLVQKDGHWRVTNKEGDLFVDGQRVSQASSRPTGNFLPQSAMIVEFVKTGKSTRDADLALAQWVKTHPKELDEQIKETIELARGKPL